MREQQPREDFHVPLTRRLASYIVERVLARPLTTMAVVVVGLLYCLLVCSDGVPVLRHDWAWPTTRSSWLPFLDYSCAGWDPRGIGSPNTRPAQCPVAAVLTPIALSAGPTAALVALLLAIVVVFAASASTATSEDRRSALFLPLLAVTPWAYTEVVAGHVVMIFAAAGLAWLVVQLCVERYRGWSLALAGAIATTQLQFALIALAILGVSVMRRPERSRVIGLVLTAAQIAPIAVALSTEYSSVASTPILTSWQAEQSIPLASAMSLSGYFTHYDSALPSIERMATMIVIVAGIILAASARKTRPFAVSAVAMALFASGERGPIGLLYKAALQHVPAIGLYRELYDLLALLPPIAILGWSTVSGRFAAYCWGLGAVAVVLVASWISAPPSRYFVYSSELPAATFPDRERGGRFAFLPWQQPLMWGSRGSGGDPDAFPGNGIIPVDEYSPTYPALSALAAGERGDRRALAALGVTEIVRRPWLHADPDAISSLSQLLGGGPSVIGSDLPVPRSFIDEEPVPRMELAPSAFVGDAFGPCDRGAVHCSAIAIPRDDANVASHWVDARLLFSALPALGQAYGGVATASPAPLEVSTSALLTAVRGRLVDAAGRTLYRASDLRYRWVTLGNRQRFVRCVGFCVVAVGADRLPHIYRAALGRQGQYLPVHYRRLTTFAFIAEPRSEPFLRVTQRYDWGWVALRGWRRLPHARVSTVFNGWFLSGGKGPVLLLFWPSTIELTLWAILAAGWFSFTVAAVSDPISWNRAPREITS